MEYPRQGERMFHGRGERCIFQDGRQFLGSDKQSDDSRLQLLNRTAPSNGLRLMRLVSISVTYLIIRKMIKA